MTSLKVLTFPAPDATSKVDPEIVETLELALQLAKDGKMSDLAIAFRDYDKETTTCYHGLNRFAVLGAVEYLAHRIKNLIGDM